MTVIPSFKLSLTSDVMVLSQFLEKQQADLVAVSSQARTGLSRLLMGSFAETLIHHSKTSLFVFNPHSKIKARITNILYAYDGTKISFEALQDVLQYAKAFDAKLHVFYVPGPQYLFNISSDENKKYHKMVDHDMSRVSQKLSSHHIPGTVQIDDNWAPISDRILKQSKKVKADLVVTVAKSGKVMSLLGGSITRQILRHSEVPVLVIKK